MNPFGSEENIVIEDVTIKVPIQKEENDSVSHTAITFKKPTWMPDTEADNCLGCKIKFTQLRRKHHCRNCGKIFCSKCCFEKMQLIHFGIIEPEKVCNNCRLIVDLMAKSNSDDPTLKLESVIGFSNMMVNAVGLGKVIECGGVHKMLSMTKDADLKLKCAIAAALNNIAQNMTLNTFLVDAGALIALKNLLSLPTTSVELISDCLTTLNSLSMDPEIRVNILKEGLVDPLLNLIRHTGTIAIFAARVLQILVSNFDCHEFLLQRHRHLISTLFESLTNEDFQMQSCISKILVYFSAGSDSYRQIIIQEDFSKNFPLLYLLKGSPPNVLLNTVCIVANLSLSVDQILANQYISGLCDLLKEICDDTGEILTHIGRGLANFSENSFHALQLVHNLKLIVSILLKSNFEAPKNHACRIIVNLFSSEPSCALDVLSKSGMDEFAEIIFTLPGITEFLNSLILRKVSRLSVCM